MKFSKKAIKVLIIVLIIEILIFLFDSDNLFILSPKVRLDRTIFNWLIITPLFVFSIIEIIKIILIGKKKQNLLSLILAFIIFVWLIRIPVSIAYKISQISRLRNTSLLSENSFNIFLKNNSLNLQSDLLKDSLSGYAGIANFLDKDTTMNSEILFVQLKFKSNEEEALFYSPDSSNIKIPNFTEVELKEVLNLILSTYSNKIDYSIDTQNLKLNSKQEYLIGIEFN